MSVYIALLLAQLGQTQVKEYPNSSEFSVNKFGTDCMLFGHYEDELKTAIVVDKDGAFFLFSQRNWKPVAGKRYKVQLELDDKVYPISTTASETGGFLGKLHPEFLESYALSNAFDITWGSKSIASLNLVGSSKAIAALRLCMKDSGLEFPPPAPPVVVPPQVKNDPFDLSEPAKMRIYRGGGYPSEAKGLEGVVRAAIKVSATGRAVDCNVIETSRSAILDEDACKGLRQSIFMAAKDKTGQPIESVIELPVRYEDPSRTVEPD